MSRQSNILSFDDVQRARGARSVRVSSDGSAAIAHQRRGHAVVRSSDMPGRGRSASSSSASSRRSSSRRVSEFSTNGKAARSSRYSFDVVERESKRSRSRNMSRANSQPLTGRRSNSIDFEREGLGSSRSASGRSRAEERKRKRSKERAGKMFSKQFAGTSNSDASENGPRAALFKGEMGAKQRRAARMQAKDTAAAAAFAPLAVLAAIPELLSKVFKTKKAAIAAFIVACFAFSCIFLYTPAQQYYQSVRETARLEAEYVAVQERNALIEKENAALATDAGMETELRERYNYVKEGEETANVSGLSENAMRNESADSVTGIVASGSVKAPDTWYSGVLDVFFGYTG